MVKKRLFIVFAVLIAILLLYKYLTDFGVIKVIKNVTSANEPGLKVDSYYLTSGLLSAERGDFVTYLRDDPNFGKSLYVHRLCGLESDTLEMKNSVLFVNGKNFDENLELKHNYKISKSEYKRIPKQIIDNEDVNLKINDTLYLISLEDSVVKKYKIKNQRSYFNSQPYILDEFNETWTRDNFGPLVIPEGKVFTLGDNRHNSNDSRFIGLINVEDVRGVIIFK